MQRARCNRCNAVVKKETTKGLRKEYPFYCPYCDENMYRFETHKKRRVNDEKKIRGHVF